MKNLKYLIGVIVVVDLILVFPIMFSWEAIGKILKVAAFPEVFTTLVVEITLLVLTSLTAYLVFQRNGFAKSFLSYGLGYFDVWSGRHPSSCLDVHGRGKSIPIFGNGQLFNRSFSFSRSGFPAGYFRFV